MINQITMVMMKIKDGRNLKILVRRTSQSARNTRTKKAKDWADQKRTYSSFERQKRMAGTNNVNPNPVAIDAKVSLSKTFRIKLL